MYKKELAVITAAALVVLGGGYFLTSSNEASAGHALEEGCNDLTDSDGVVEITVGGPAAQFDPSCVRVSNGDTIKFIHDGDIAHNPGDVGDGGSHDNVQAPECFEANDDIGKNLQAGETYSIELTFDTQTEELFRSNAWFNGNEIGNEFLDPGKDEVCADATDDVWEYTSSDENEIRLDYVCHIHPLSMHGVILIEV